MTWKPADYVDEEVRAWMRAKRWEVTTTNYNFDQEIYSWRHQQPDGQSPTLRIARSVFEHNPPFVVLYHPDRLNVAGAILAQPGARLVVIQEGPSIVLKEIPPSRL